MEDLCSMWSYQESIDEFKQKIINTTVELEQAKEQANKKMAKNKEHINHLLGLLKIAYQERDEARKQIQKLSNKATPQTQLGKANLSITESNSHDRHSDGSSIIDSFSPDIQLANSANTSYDNQTSIQDYNGLVLGNLVNGTVFEKPKMDPASAIIDDLAKGKSLPQKGRLLQTVLKSEPLLQTLIVAGKLPIWRNPPTRSCKIPPVPIKWAENVAVTQNLGADQVQWTRKQENYLPAYHDTSRLSPQLCSTSVLNFSATGNIHATGIGFENSIPANKRHRFQ